MSDTAGRREACAHRRRLSGAIVSDFSECDGRLQTYLAGLPTRTAPAADTGAAPPPPAVATGKKKKRAKKAGGGNAPCSFNLAAELTRISGVNALRIDGINLITFQTIVAELGTDLGNWFPTEHHFASWLGLTPRRDVSGGKVIRHTREKSRNRVAGVLRMAANALVRSDSYLGARYRNLRTRLGSPKAIKAMARYLACIVYRLFTKGQAWVDRGAEHFERNRQARDLARLQAQAGSRGFRLVPVTG
jgi:transposase